MKVGIITELTSFGKLQRWSAAWTCKDGRTRKVVTGQVISEEDQNEPTLMRLHEQTFATALGMAIIQNPPKDGD